MEENKQYYLPFPTRLRQLIDERKVSQQEVADYVGISRQAVAQWKDGKTIPDAYNFQKVSEFFGVPYDYMLGKSDSRVHENMLLAENLGLSDGAIAAIRDMRVGEPTDADDKYISRAEIVSNILESPQFQTAIGYLREAVLAHRDFSERSVYDESGNDYTALGMGAEDRIIAANIGKSIIGTDKMAVFCLYQAADAFRSIIEKIPEEKYLEQIGLKHRKGAGRDGEHTSEEE